MVLSRGVVRVPKPYVATAVSGVSHQGARGATTGQAQGGSSDKRIEGGTGGVPFGTARERYQQLPLDEGNTLLRGPSTKA